MNAQVAAVKPLDKVPEKEPEKVYEIFMVPADDVLRAWPVARKLLKKGIDRSSGRWNREYVLAELIYGRHTLWLIRDVKGVIVGAATLQVAQYPNKRMLAMHFLGGKDIDKWYSQISETVFEYGRSCGCTVVETIGREGLWKWYQTSGFKKNGVCYEMEL